MADMGQIDMKEMTRRYSEEETVRIMKEIMENNVMMLKLQKQIIELQVAEEEKKKKQRRQEEREQERREYEERWEEEEQRRQKKKSR